MNGVEATLTDYFEGTDSVFQSVRTRRVLEAILLRIKSNEPNGREFEPILIDPPYYLWDAPDLDVHIGELSNLEAATTAQRGEYTFTINVIRKVSPILRGYIEHVETIRIRQHPLVTYLIAVEGLKDTLDRDHHGVVGWHYHYCNRRGQRSNTMLSFDTNQNVQLNGPETTAQFSKPLFWERHSEANARFSARAELWGSGKRKSVFDAIKPDLKKWSGTDFRRPGMAAQAVWPIGTILSPPPRSR